MQTASTHSNSAKMVDGASDPSTSNITHEFKSFIADVEDLVKATSNLKGDELHEAKAKIQQRISMAKDSMEEVSDNLIKRTRQAADTANHYVHEQPWGVIGASAAIGLLMGYLVARRS